jgi:hypothetical protein
MQDMKKTMFTFIFCHRAASNQDHYFAPSLSYANTVLWCRSCKIYRYVTAPFHNYTKDTVAGYFWKNLYHMLYGNTYSGLLSDGTSLKGRDQWESRRVWRVANDRNIIGTVVIDVLFFKKICLHGVLNPFPFPLATADWLGNGLLNRHSAANC